MEGQTRDDKRKRGKQVQGAQMEVTGGSINYLNKNSERRTRMEAAKRA